MPDVELKRLRYRLRRQGMLELDAWLSRLEPELGRMPVPARAALARLLTEIPSVELLAMMHGERPIPPELAAWLQS